MTNRPQRASAPQTWALTALALALQSVPVLAQAPGAPLGPAQWASQETAAPGKAVRACWRPRRSCWRAGATAARRRLHQASNRPLCA